MAGMVTSYKLGWSGVRMSGASSVFSSSQKPSTPALGPNQLSVQWIPGFCTGGKAARA